MPEERLTLLQNLVAGYIGFGLFLAVLCAATGADIVTWFVMTTFLTVSYTLYYSIKIAREDRRRPAKREEDE